MHPFDFDWFLVAGTALAQYVRLLNSEGRPSAGFLIPAPLSRFAAEDADTQTTVTCGVANALKLVIDEVAHLAVKVRDGVIAPGKFRLAAIEQSAARERASP